MENAFFDSWETLLRTLTVGVLSYVVMVVFLRMSGKRTLSKMNAFDFVVTVALGSTLATMLLNRNVALAEGRSGHRAPRRSAVPRHVVCCESWMGEKICDG